MRRWLSLILLGVILGVVGTSHAAMLRFAWDASATAERYRLYYGEAPGLYQVVLDIGPYTHAAVGGLRPKVRYFFACTAVNAGGESAFSNEIDVVPNPGGNAP
jgi:hypothetical protein